ncbi:MAG: shikimate kinase [candidate division Zixibacteria bacterium]|nr:shikimate kinase [candidate division Zixibacteria bacterium]
MKPLRHIFLIGFSGSGKSTLGRVLAAKLRYRFIDLDGIIEEFAQLSVSEIFAKRGETAFRRLEKAQLKRVLGSTRAKVIALGGGAFESADIRDLARNNAVTIFLSCSQRELYRRMRDVGNRPLLEGRPHVNETPTQAKMRRIRDMLRKRLANYRTADLIVSTTDKSVAQSARQLVRLLKNMS